MYSDTWICRLHSAYTVLHKYYAYSTVRVLQSTLFFIISINDIKTNTCVMHCYKCWLVEFGIFHKICFMRKEMYKYFDKQRFSYKAVIDAVVVYDAWCVVLCCFSIVERTIHTLNGTIEWNMTLYEGITTTWAHDTCFGNTFSVNRIEPKFQR